MQEKTTDKLSAASLDLKAQRLPQHTNQIRSRLAALSASVV
jgi:hypothetical protein